MKVKTISRFEEHFTKETRSDITKRFRNLDPAIHPFERAREYTRALTAAKLERMFAKPFVHALDGHLDGVYCTATSQRSLVQFLSGACDGEVRIWDMSTRKCAWKAAAHRGFVRGLAVAPDGRTVLSCGDDGTVKQWELRVAVTGEPEPEPLKTWRSRDGGMLRSLDHHWAESKFATGGDAVDLWDCSRADAVATLRWGADTVHCVRYNPAERHLLLGAGSDRAICLYDTRAAASMRKLVLQSRTNAVAWNPREPMNFAAACDDNNVFSFDMRSMGQATMVHRGHMGAVVDVCFSPTGRELATAGYDKTVRIFNTREGRSREVYQTARMQRVFCVRYTADSRFVVSGSDDTNLRIWKSMASERLGPAVSRERRALAYRETLKKRYGHLPEIRKILRHRHVPRQILKAAEAERAARDKARRKMDNVEKHSKPGTVTFAAERKKHFVSEVA